MFISLGERRVLTADPDLLPSPALMRRQRTPDLETWFARGREWRLALTTYGGLGHRSWIQEIGCGWAENAFAIRDVFSSGGHYHGLSHDPDLASTLEETFAAKFPRFRFSGTPVRQRATEIPDYVLPFPACPDGTYHIVFSSEAFTRLPPEELAAMFAECARILKPSGRLLAAMHVLDNIEPGCRRPPQFANAEFEFGAPREGVAVAAGRPRGRVAFSTARLGSLAAQAGLELVGAPAPGRWSGAGAGVVDLDLVVLQKVAR